MEQKSNRALASQQAGDSLVAGICPVEDNAAAILVIDHRRDYAPGSHRDHHADEESQHDLARAGYHVDQCSEKDISSAEREIS